VDNSTVCQLNYLFFHLAIRKSALTSEQLGELLGPSQVARKQVVRLDNYIKGIDQDARQRREDVCLANLMDSLGFMVGRYFVLDAFPGDNKKHAERIIDDVINAFHENLPNLEWLDDETREKAQRKVRYLLRFMLEKQEC
jgi:endothelin-converting enzyme